MCYNGFMDWSKLKRWIVWSGERRFIIHAPTEQSAGDKARRYGYSVDRIDAC